jgi:hypothetical protein
MVPRLASLNLLMIYALNRSNIVFAAIDADIAVDFALVVAMRSTDIVGSL